MSQLLQTLRTEQSLAQVDGYPAGGELQTELARTSPFNLSPCKPFQHCPLTQWIFLASFIEIPPLIKRDIASREIDVNGRMDGNRNRWMIGKHNAFAAYYGCVGIKGRTQH